MFGRISPGRPRLDSTPMREPRVRAGVEPPARGRKTPAPLIWTRRSLWETSGNGAIRPGGVIGTRSALPLKCDGASRSEIPSRRIVDRSTSPAGLPPRFGRNNHGTSCFRFSDSSRLARLGPRIACRRGVDRARLLARLRRRSDVRGASIGEAIPRTIAVDPQDRRQFAAPALLDRRPRGVRGFIREDEPSRSVGPSPRRLTRTSNAPAAASSRRSLVRSTSLIDRDQ